MICGINLIGQTNIGDVHYVTDKFVAPFSIYVADIDDDDANDIITSSSLDTIVWFRNLGKGDFSEAIIISHEMDNVRSVFACDIDKDGDNDIISGSRGDSAVAWFANNGNEEFGNPEIVYTGIDDLLFVGGYDMDNDGDIDIVAANYYRIYILMNDGNCSFFDPVIHTTSFNRNLCISDINGDNLPEVFTASLMDEGILWFRNNGSGDFSSNYISVYDRTSECNDIDVADINGDGKPDLITTTKVDSYYGKVSWFEYNNNSFDFKKRIGLKYEVFQKVAAGNLNSDTIGDVFAANNHYHTLYWYHKDDPWFESYEIPYHVDEASEILLSDMDMDGDIDVVMSELYGNKIVWFENLFLEVLQQPEDQLVCAMDIVTISTHIKDAISYQWFVRKENNQSYSAIDEEDDNYIGYNTDELQIVNMQLTMANNKYYCRASNGYSYVYTDTIVLKLVTDPEPPNLQVKNANLYLSSSATTNLPANLVVDLVEDNCNYVDVSLSKEVFSCNNLGENYIDVTAIDGSGNDVTKTVVLTVIDTISPEIQMVDEEIEIFTPGSSYTFDFEYSPITLFYDNCSVESLSNNKSNNESLYGVELLLGTTEVIWTVTDNYGNKTNRSQRITLTNQNSYSIYPNPANHYIMIKQDHIGQYSFKIFDISGKDVYQSANVSGRFHRFNSSLLKRGTYIVQIDNGLSLEDYKVVIAR